MSANKSSRFIAIDYSLITFKVLSTKSEASQFLNEFKTKYSVFDILFRDHRKKNAEALLELDITPLKEKKLLKLLKSKIILKGRLMIYFMAFQVCGFSVKN